MGFPKLAVCADILFSLPAGGVYVKNVGFIPGYLMSFCIGML